MKCNARRRLGAGSCSGFTRRYLRTMAAGLVLGLVALLSVEAKAQPYRVDGAVTASGGTSGNSGAADAVADAGAPAAAPAAAELQPPPPPASAPLLPPPVTLAPTPSAGALVVPATPPAAAPAVVTSAAAPRVAASGDPRPRAATVQVGERTIYEVRVGRGGQSADQRARAATRALNNAIETESHESVRIERREDVAVVYAGVIPVLQLGVEDAKLAGDPSLDVHADRVAAAVREGIRTEQKRSAIATTVFSASLAVLFALIAAYLLRKTTEFAARGRAWLTQHREKIPGIRVKSLEVIGPAALRSGAALAVELTKWLTRFGIVYLWLLVTLSLFAATRGYTEKLTGYVLSPLSALAARIATSLPVLIVALIAAVVVGVLLRFVSLFFASVARGETTLAWVPADLAEPTSVLLRAAIVILAVVFAAPVVTGDNGGALARSGLVVLAAIGIASTPILACALAGVGTVFLRRVRVGDVAEFGGRSGRVRHVGLLEVILDGDAGAEIRVPQLLSLFHPTSVQPGPSRTSVELALPLTTSPAAARAILSAAAASVGSECHVDVLRLDASSATYLVSVVGQGPQLKTALYLAIGETLHFAGGATEPPPIGGRS